MSRLVVISNRVGPLSDSGKAGGLAVGLGDALRKRGGLWFGWSGNTSEEGTFGPLQLQREGEVQLATVDITPSEEREFYAGYANRTLWPLLHYRLDLADFDRRFEETYRRINERFAARVLPLLKPDDQIWVHDYHFVYLGAKLREMGVEAPIGYFLHVPFPAPEILAALPNADNFVRALLAYDVVGFQTERDQRNFRRYVVEELGGRTDDGEQIVCARRCTLARAFPIGIDAEGYAGFARSEEARTEQKRVEQLLHGRQQIVGVDRLDYSKGLPERFRAFERLLTDYPENRGKVSLFQIAPLSRESLDAYAELRDELEQMAGHVNGQFGEVDWVPIRFVTRGTTRKALAGIYRASSVALLTPLRDGMNLVAKEYVAAQNPKDPGVLVLSRFTGAAEGLTAALIVNPFDPENVAEALERALNMPLEERLERWEALREEVWTHTAQSWCQDFLSVLSAVGEGGADEAESASSPSIIPHSTYQAALAGRRQGR